MTARRVSIGDGADSRPTAEHPAGGPLGCFSCVVDDQPRFHLDALRWFVTLTTVAGVSPSDLIVYVVGTDHSDVLNLLREAGVAVRPIQPFDPRSPHCNKISGAQQLADDGVEGLAVLCDTDIVVLEDPRAIELSSHAIGGKLVDAPVPPLAVILEIFTAANVKSPPIEDLPWGSGDQTVAGNFNGGLYLVPGPLLSKVAASWAHWATWLLERRELLREWPVYVDQVAMALAQAELETEPFLLDVRWNTPTHDRQRIRPDAPEPAVIHYHQELDRSGTIRPTGIDAIDRRIQVANDAIANYWRNRFPWETYREWLFLTGTGVPDVPDLAANRAALLALLDKLEPRSVLEVGCGDDGITRDVPIENYLGIDSSPGLVRAAKAARPEGSFFVGSLGDNPQVADLTVCFGALLKHRDSGDYQTAVRELYDSATLALLVSGLEGPSETYAGSIYYHEPLSTTLHRVAPEAEVYPVAQRGAVQTFAVLKPPEDRHPRDYGSSTLTPLIERHPDPTLLMKIRLDARRSLGFYPDHAPRLWEYPVVTALLTQHLPGGGHIVDVGAGTTPLAPFLTSEGYRVDTVDPSSNRRVWPPKPDWNEWDFLDYREAGLANRSWNCTLGELPTRTKYDGAYSVSVIEHVPASVRRALLKDISERVRVGGVVVLTIDLVRDTDRLWNMNLGVQVEQPSEHGVIADVIQECAEVGLNLIEQRTVREWGETDVDIGLFVTRKATATKSTPRRSVARLFHRFQLRPKG